MSRRRDSVGWLIVGAAVLAAWGGAIATTTSVASRTIDGQTLTVTSAALEGLAPWLVAGATITLLSLACIAHASVRANRADGLGPAIGVGVLAASALVALVVPAPHAHVLTLLPAMAASHRAAWCLVWSLAPLSLGALVACIALARTAASAIAPLACLLLGAPLIVAESGALVRELEGPSDPADPMRARSALFGDCLLGPHGPMLCSLEDAAERRDIAIAAVLTLGLSLPFVHTAGRGVVRLVSVDGAPLEASVGAPPAP